MTAPLWVTQLAADFWESAGGPGPCPRDLRGPALRCSLDLTIKELAGLSVGGVEDYLGRLGVAWLCGTADRPLRGCLVASRGAGFILLDAGDCPAERAFTLAHEVAHFLRHYCQPRRLACRHLGAGAAEVLDGARPPTAAERFRALLADVPVGLHVHLMRRGPRRVPAAETAVAEEEADLLTYELLAPAAAVLARVGRACGARGRAEMAAVLRDDFGLPQAQADDYALRLLPPLPDEAVLRRLGR